MGNLRYRHEIRPLAELRRRTGALFARLRRTRKPVILVEDGQPQGVLLDVRTYSELRETELLLEVMAQGRREATPKKGAR